MALEAKLYNALTSAAPLTALVGNSIYPLRRVQGADLPSVVYRRALGIRDYTLSGYSTLENPHVAIELYTSSVDMRLSVFDAVVDALDATTTFSMTLTASPIDMYNDETGVYARSLDVSIWNRE